MIDYKNPDYVSIIAERQKNLDKLRRDPLLFQAAKMHYSKNTADFIDDWCWTYDPRKENAYLPFILFPKQRELIEWLDNCYMDKEDGLIEKSRDMGITWVTCAWAATKFLFKDGIKISFGSRKEKLVDELGNSDSIFEKIRIILRMIPIEFLPYYQDQMGNWMMYKEDRDAMHLRIINRASGATITGEAGDNIGRGGRSSIYFKDESAFYERAEKIEAALSQNSDVKIDLSTPNGAGNPFYLKREQKTVRIFTFHWTSDPRKDQKWYDDQCKKFEKHIIAQELDIDYQASIEGICIPPEWVKASINFCEKYNIVPTGEKQCGLDVADDVDRDANAMVIRHGIEAQQLHTWGGISVGQSMTKCYDICESQGVELIKFDNIGVGAGAKSKVYEIYEVKTNPIQIEGINAGSTKMIGEWETGKKNVDQFQNMKALMWWNVRRRFKKTYEYVNNIEKHDPDECISIKGEFHELIRQLSLPRHFTNENGKIKIEPKDSLRARGIKSHDEADAFVLAFSPLMKYKSGVF